MLEPTRRRVSDIARESWMPFRSAHSRAATLIGTFVLAASYFVPVECRAGDLPRIPTLSLDRSLQQPLATARSLIARGQTAEAIRALQPLLSDRENALVEMDGRYVDAKVAANEL